MRAQIIEYSDEYWYEEAAKNVPPEMKRERHCGSSGRSGFLERKSLKTENGKSKTPAKDLFTPPEQI